MPTATATAERVSVHVPVEMAFMGADFLADAALTELFADDRADCQAALPRSPSHRLGRPR